MTIQYPTECRIALQDVPTAVRASTLILGLATGIAYQLPLSLNPEPHLDFYATEYIKVATLLKDIDAEIAIDTSAIILLVGKVYEEHCLKPDLPWFKVLYNLGYAISPNTASGGAIETFNELFAKLKPFGSTT